MENPKPLYPLSFNDIPSSTVWGTERALIADTALAATPVQEGWLADNSLPDLMETYLERIVGDKVLSWYGRQFPLSVKKLEVSGRTALTVCPDDETAAQRYDALGNAKCWVVLEAGENACLWLGFKKDTDAGELWLKNNENGLAPLLNKVTPHKGEAYLIAPGTVHAAQDVTLLEISEASDLNLLISDWGRRNGQPTMLEEALDLIDYRKLPVEALRPIPVKEDGVVAHLVSRDEFLLNRLAVNDPLHIYTEQYESFIIYACAQGEVSVQWHEGGQTCNAILKTGQALLIPAEMEDFFLVPREKGSVLLEAYLQREEHDAYINPDVPAEIAQ
ncbi:MAG: hypothetical protein J6Y32_04865 [Bacteroidales bacterium]|nr:hypothetical protein [Bacteroidales bacterium]